MELFSNVYEYVVSGKKLTIATGNFAFQTNASVVVRYGDSTVLVNATMSKQIREGLDFFPLVVNLEEKMYAAGKIPGGFIKREGRPGDPSIITSRLIDRPIRPRFNQDMRNEVQIIAMVLSADQENPPDILALAGTAAALHISDIPFDGPIGGIRIAEVDGELIANPTYSQLDEASMNLVVAGTADKVQLIEFEGNEISRERVADAAELACKINGEFCELLEKMRSEIGKPKLEVEIPSSGPEDLVDKVTKTVGPLLPRMFEATNKKERDSIFEGVTDDVILEILGEEPAEMTQDVAAERAAKKKMIKGAIYDSYKKFVRKSIIENNKRIDGRTPDDIRDIWGVTSPVPRVHGSAIFTRGETQGLTLVTLGAIGDQQKVDDIHVLQTKRYMHHYNGLPFCYGETGMVRGAGRREIGHGMLAEKALSPMIPEEEEFPYTIRLVTEILSSNGSTSMAATCGSSLALMDAGVPIKRPVSGIAMGLMTSEDGKAIILKDIMGVEDFFGDMDFKVAGTTEGITAIQLDLKIDGLTMELLREALEKADEGRAYILGKMNEVISSPRDELSPYAPRIFTMMIPVDRIGDVIGPGGKTIRSIIEETGVEIDINDDGRVFITAFDAEGARQAQDRISALTEEIEIDKIYTGKVVKIMSFGAFVELIPGRDGLLHVSQITGKQRINEVEDVIKVGDILKVRVYEIDDQGRNNLTRKGVTDDPFDEIIDERLAELPKDGSGGGRQGNGPPRRGGGASRGGGRRDRR